MAVEIIAPGLASSVQDRGRFGHYDVGIPPSGAVDLYSAGVANLLVGNDPGAAVIEAAYLGPEFPADVDLRVVLGLYDYRLTDQGLATLLDTTWVLTPVADRIGFRYSGGQLEWRG